MASLSGAFLSVGGITLLSRVLGLVRDLLIARLFGADGGTDAFFVAFKIPNFLRRWFAEGAFSAACVPFFSPYQEAADRPAFRQLLGRLVGLLGVLLSGLLPLGLLAAPVLVLLLAPGFAWRPQTQALAVDLMRLTFPYLALVAFAALAGAVLNSRERFAIPAFAPILLNLGILAGALCLAPFLEPPILALAWGVLAGGLAQLLFPLPALHRLGLLPRPRLARDPVVEALFRRLGPTLLGLSVVQLSLLLDTAFASFLQAGSISWLYYADRLLEFPLGILGSGLGIVILPRLARAHGQNAPESFSRTLDWALRWVLLLGLPATLGLVILAGPLMVTLFHGGEFGASDARMAAAGLLGYAWGLPALMAIKVLARGYLARGDATTPMNLALIALGINFALNLALVGILGLQGLALATSAAALANAGGLILGLRRRRIYHPLPGWKPLLARVLGAALALGILLTWGCPDLSAWLAWNRGQCVLHLGLWVVFGVAAYSIGFFALGGRLRHLSEGDPRAFSFSS